MQKTCYDKKVEYFWSKKPSYHGKRGGIALNKQRKRAISPFCSKLVLTIGFLICVPMLLIQILLFVSSYSTLHRQNDQYYYLKTQSLSSRFSAQLAGFRKIALKISSASYTSS